MRLLALAVIALFAGTLCADSIIYFKAGPRGREPQSIDRATVTAWSASRVEYKDKDGKAGSVPAADVMSVQREGKELSGAIEMISSDRAAAMATLRKLAAGGNALDKEEATYWIARVLANESNGNAGAINEAIGAAQAYTRAYKGGYFAREVYRAQADLQLRAKRVADARATLKAMIGADPALARDGNQMLGELEYGQGKYAEAVSAFQGAKSLAAREKNKNFEYMAQAWEGAATLKKGDANAAKTLLEGVTNDQNFEDNSTSDDEIALAIAYPALGEVHMAAGKLQLAYDAYILAAYYAWWTQDARVREGESLGEAYKCAKKLEGADEKWKARKKKLQTALQLGFPQILQKIDQAG